MRLQQHPRDAPLCATRPAAGAALPAELSAPPAVLDAMARGAARVLRGLGARAGGAGAELLASTPDGLPLLGSHAGFEDGRVIVAAAAGGTSGTFCRYCEDLLMSTPTPDRSRRAPCLSSLYRPSFFEQFAGPIDFYCLCSCLFRANLWALGGQYERKAGLNQGVLSVRIDCSLCANG